MKNKAYKQIAASVLALTVVGTAMPSGGGHIGLFDGFSVTADAAGEVEVSTWTDLKTAVDSAADGTVIKLTEDIKDTTASTSSSSSVIKVNS